MNTLSLCDQYQPSEATLLSNVSKDSDVLVQHFLDEDIPDVNMWLDDLEVEGIRYIRSDSMPSGIFFYCVIFQG